MKFLVQELIENINSNAALGLYTDKTLLICWEHT